MAATVELVVYLNNHGVIPVLFGIIDNISVCGDGLVDDLLTVPGSTAVQTVPAVINRQGPVTPTMMEGDYCYYEFNSTVHVSSFTMQGNVIAGTHKM